MDDFDSFVCPINPKPLSEWFKEDDEKICKPCKAQPLASLYLSVLNDAKEVQLAKNLSKAFESQDILTLTKEMDSIKDNVRGEVKKTLLKLDCMVQTLKE
jgi:hypothetical protein